MIDVPQLRITDHTQPDKRYKMNGCNTLGLGLCQHDKGHSVFYGYNRNPINTVFVIKRGDFIEDVYRIAKYNPHDKIFYHIPDSDRSNNNARITKLLISVFKHGRQKLWRV